MATPDELVAQLIDELGEPAYADGRGPSAPTVAKLLRVRDLLGDHRQRESELAALVEAARDLTKVRDVDRALQAVTDRTRVLLSSDVAYLSARTGDDDDFAVRAWSGQLSPAFLGTRVGLGSGVGGMVVRTRRPFQVEDYAASETFEHSDYLNQQVGAEGIQALLGVPLEVDGHLLGILFAGRRRAEVFSERQVDLVSSLAAHAAVALDNAQLFDAQMRALRDLEASTEALRAHTAAVETSAEVHAQLTGALQRGQGVAEIARIVADALGGDVTMVDADGVELCRHGAHPPTTPLGRQAEEALRRTRTTGRSERLAGPDGRTWHVTSALAGTRFLGSVVLAGRRDLTDVDVRTLERATQTVAVSLLTEAAAAEAEARASGDVVRRLLDLGELDPARFEALARRHGLGSGPTCVVVAETVPERLGAQVAAATRLAGEVGGLAAVHEERVVLLLAAEADEGARRTWEAVRDATGTGATVTAADVAGSAFDLGRTHREAVQCLLLMDHLGRAGTWTTAGRLGVYALLFTPGSVRQLDQLVESCIGPVVAYDAKHATSLATTALAYLDHGSSAARTAEQLGIHPNTVAQRLVRLDRLLGAQWRRPGRQLDVHAALRLHDLRSRVDAPGPE